MLLLIDNYDSFTWNLVQYFGEIAAPVVVVRNDAASAGDLLAMHPAHIVISPGPGRPEQAGITLDIIRRTAPEIPILGVCLGHQAIGLAFGASVVRAVRPVHGKTSRIEHDGHGLFAGLRDPITAGRYHSLVVADEALPAELEVSARSSDDGAIMGLRHRTRPVHGVQFHPESVLTPVGRQLLRNFVATNGETRCSQTCSRNSAGARI
jgi:anthranilate synthase/aminodeoxychorismate synthase-like glutamine amidotransferase